MSEPTTSQKGWNERVPSTRAWKARTNMDRAARSAEQDRAAGGPHCRVMRLGEGREAQASVALRLYRGRRVRAYLRWSDRGRTRERYIGEVDAESRRENLRLAWEAARAAGMVEEGRLPADSWASSRASRSVMRGNRGRDTRPELLLRSRLHGMGFRYRVAKRPVPEIRRTADLVFTRARVAVFVDGCFWHGCPEHYRPARRNSEFWNDKIDRNKERDGETDEALRARGWTVVRVWEHEEVSEAAEKVIELLRRASDGERG